MERFLHEVRQMAPAVPPLAGRRLALGVFAQAIWKVLLEDVLRGIAAASVGIRSLARMENHEH